MITGRVNDNLEAIVRLSVYDAAGHVNEIDGVVDTGFNGFLTLPAASINTLALPFVCRRQGELADGSLETFDVYAAAVVWDGVVRTIEVDRADTEPLIGMGLLHGHELRVHVAAGGHVAITAATP
ncbi:MAG: clan AA aspartic protease [Planctomycetia bacterium]|nr:clan AA aspartic protease [Planctomycetia bacterium]